LYQAPLLPRPPYTPLVFRLFHPFSTHLLDLSHAFFLVMLSLPSSRGPFHKVSVLNDVMYYFGRGVFRFPFCRPATFCPPGFRFLNSDRSEAPSRVASFLICDLIVMYCILLFLTQLFFCLDAPYPPLLRFKGQKFGPSSFFRPSIRTFSRPVPFLNFLFPPCPSEALSAPLTAFLPRRVDLLSLAFFRGGHSSDGNHLMSGPREVLLSSFFFKLRSDFG